MMEKTEIELSISLKVLGILFVINLAWMGMITGLFLDVQLLHLPVILIVGTSSIIVTGLIAAIIYHNHPELRLDDDSIYIGKAESKQLTYDDIDRIYTAPGAMKIVAGARTLFISNVSRNYAQARTLLEKKAGGRMVKKDWNNRIAAWGLILFVMIEIVLLL